jgi:hypothetical protein
MGAGRLHDGSLRAEFDDDLLVAFQHLVEKPSCS